MSDSPGSSDWPVSGLSSDVRLQDSGDDESSQGSSSTPDRDDSDGTGNDTASARTASRTCGRYPTRQSQDRLTSLHGSIAQAHLCGVAVKDESFCDCPQTSHSRELVCHCGEEDSGFEWVWDKSSKSSATDLSEDVREVKFHVNYSSGTAAVKGFKPMTDRQHFWEIKMTTPVYGTDIMVGVGTDAVDLNAFRYSFCSLLGKDGESWGYSYFGRTQHKNDFKKLVKGRFGQGSIIGVHLDMWHGAVSFYKNRQPLGCAYSGLGSKTLYPMVSSTAARTGMRLIKSCSFSTSLQFLCCQALRKLIPAHLDVTEALALPPGLHAFLTNNLSWLLRPCALATDCTRHGSPRKRSHDSDSYSKSDDTHEAADSASARKRARVCGDSADASSSRTAPEQQSPDSDSELLTNGS